MPGLVLPLSTLRHTYSYINFRRRYIHFVIRASLERGFLGGYIRMPMLHGEKNGILRSFFFGAEFITGLMRYYFLSFRGDFTPGKRESEVSRVVRNDKRRKPLVN